jgi:hypothetical protein
MEQRICFSARQQYCERSDAAFGDIKHAQRGIDDVMLRFQPIKCTQLYSCLPSA